MKQNKHSKTKNMKQMMRKNLFEAEQKNVG